MHKRSVLIVKELELFCVICLVEDFFQALKIVILRHRLELAKCLLFSPTICAVSKTYPLYYYRNFFGCQQ